MAVGGPRNHSDQICGQLSVTAAVIHKLLRSQLSVLPLADTGPVLVKLSVAADRNSDPVDLAVFTDQKCTVADLRPALAELFEQPLDTAICHQGRPLPDQLRMGDPGAAIGLPANARTARQPQRRRYLGAATTGAIRSGLRPTPAAASR